MITNGMKKTFKKTERLARKDIRELYQKGKKLKVGEYLGIYLYNQKNYPRLGVGLKKKLGNAVLRNYERRVVKESFRQFKTILPGVDLFILKLAQFPSSFQEKQKKLYQLFSRIKEMT